jgi:hypothetical protein
MAQVLSICSYVNIVYSQDHQIEQGHAWGLEDLSKV